MLTRTPLYAKKLKRSTAEPTGASKHFNVACDLEINANSSNHKVILTDNATAESRWNMIFSSIPYIIGNNDKKVIDAAAPR
ncbi:hypothetical protein EON65_23950 [archaeon]|nr:MAG: hypothetical protein EON65_23950 [archaeon]